MDTRRYVQSRLRRGLETAVYFAAVGGVLAASAWLIFGPTAILWLAVLGAFVAWSAAKLPLSVVLRRQGARPLSFREAPELTELVHALARRAGLRRAPALHFIASQQPQAFAVASGHHSAVAVTAGLLRMMAPRELAGVLAHEMSHLKSGDTRVLMAARWMSGVTRSLTTAGFLLALLSALLIPEVSITPLTFAVLLFAPTISGLAFLALSRTREFDADAAAAGLTGDPRGLASGLVKLRSYEESLWHRLLPFPVPRPVVPESLRTHPDTDERVRRLLELSRRSPQPRPLARAPLPKLG